MGTGPRFMAFKVLHGVWKRATSKATKEEFYESYVQYVDPSDALNNMEKTVPFYLSP